MGIAPNGDAYINTHEYIYLATASSHNASVYLTFPSPFDRTWSDQPPLFAVSPSGSIYYSLDDPATLYISTHQVAEGDSAPTTLGGADTRLDYLRDLAIGPQGKLFAIDSRGRILVFAAKSSPFAVPEAQWSGDATQLDSPGSLAVSSQGEVCAGNENYQSRNTITCYSVGRYGDVAPSRQISGDRTLIERNLVDLAVDRDGRIYALTNNPDRILIFATNTQGNASPIRVIAGPRTALSEPFAIAIDSKSRVIVLNYRSNSITLYTPEATGDARPISVIRGTLTQMHQPQHLALMPNSDILVSSSTRKLLRFNGNRLGNVAPIVSYVDQCVPFLGRFAVDQRGRIYLPGCANDLQVVNLRSGGGLVHKEFIMSSSRSVFYRPTSLAFDGRGNLFVADANHLLEFGPGARGDVAPSRIWSFHKLSHVDGLAVADGTVYLADSEKNTIDVEALTSTSVLNAKKYISGDETQISKPESLAVDLSGRLYVANEASDTVSIFAPNSAGNVPPIATLRGFWTRLSSPTGIGIGPDGEINVLSGPLQYTSYPYLPQPTGEVLVFRSGSSGNVAPIRVTQFTRICASDSL